MTERHEKWQRVEPGTVIPAGQPYRIEWPKRARPDQEQDAAEYVCETELTYTGWWDGHGADCYLDSSWRPPLVLPTEPCVIRAKVDSWDYPRILFGHPNPGEEQGMTFCRAVDGLGYKRDEIESFEVLWVDDPEGRA